MHIYEGKLVDGITFFNLLNESTEFCSEMGRVVLAAGRLESSLIQVVNKNQDVDASKWALGRLIKYAEKHEDLSKIVPHLEMLKMQRNYLTHNIFALLVGRIDETILEGRELLDSDVVVYTDRARQLAHNLNAISDIVERF